MASLKDSTADEVTLDTTGQVTNTGQSWTAPTLSGTWVNYGGSYQTARYTKVNGWVFIEGLVKDGAVWTSVFTLPAGYRPTSKHLIWTSLADDTDVHGQIRVFTDGTIINFGSVTFCSITCNFFVGS